MTLVLITNDDGYTSAGYLPLVTELATDFTVLPVVPDHGKSWISKAITMKKKITNKKTETG